MTAAQYISVVLILLPLLGLYATYKFWKWHNKHGTRFLWGLFLASIVTDLAATGVAFVATARILTPIDEPLPAWMGLMLGAFLFPLEGIFFYLVIRWRDLDKKHSIEHEAIGAPVETQNQREDRLFGEQRRDLEDEHVSDKDYER